ncbi:hypothetical protein E1301_Tti023237 [Triplophysa tibetana]|uniref:CxC3 like cysteine cluster domain-containing protein n=1 Tax=Triplophysa tibetana TaxID=1572043 RepID=A0A5A9PHA5_9TELE|nr:hypothetical protein E1301_Tti023237 [Triplophysa tibetana]
MTSCDKDQLDELLKKGQAVTATLNSIDDINQMDGLIKKGQTDAAKLSQDYCRTELDELLKQGQTIIQNLSHDGPKVRLEEVLNQSRELIEQLTQNDHMVHPVSAKKNARKSTYKVRSRKRDKPIFVNKSRQIPKPSISTHHDLEANKSKTKPTVQQGFRQQDHARLLPMALPVSICQCGEKKYNVGKGRSITVINMTGRYDLSIPRLYCERCQENWAPGLREVQDTGYGPGTINFSTLYDFEVFLSFEDLKMAAPDSVNLLTKKKVFDKVMLIQRLEEEQVILVQEAKQHWLSMQSRQDKMTSLLDTINAGGNPWNLSEEGIQGLHFMLQRRLDQLTAHRDTLKKSYQMIDNMTTCSTVEDEYVSCLEDHLSSSTDQSSDEDDTSVY